MIALQDVMKNVLTWVKPIGDLQLKGLKENTLNTNIKGSAIDYVTDYDLKSEKILIAHIESSYPDHSILGEEGGVRDKGGDYQWVLDPIDGTTNYAHGFPFFCISIGLKYKGDTVLGVVYAPMLNYTFRAIKGEGAFLNDMPIKTSKTNTLMSSIIGTGFPYSRAENNINLAYFNKLINHISGVRRCGSAALDLCMVASGMLDAYWEFCLNEWDICAGVLFVKEAGGCIDTVCIGDYNMLIASNPHVYHVLKDKLFE